MLRLLNTGYRDFSISPVPVTERLNWEIYVVADGELAPVFEDQKRIPLKQNFIWVMPRGLSYGWRSGKKPVLRYAFHFTSVPEVLQKTVVECGYFARGISSGEIREIDRIFKRMERQFHRFQPLSALKIERAMIDLVLLVLDGVPLTSDMPLDQMDEQRVESALTWYADNMADCPTIDAVAHAVHVSSGHLRRLFKRGEGCSPHERFLEMRLEQAKEILSKTSQTLAEIGKQCGFGSSSDFCRVFAKHVGVSPHKWRNHVTRQEATGTPFDSR